MKYKSSITIGKKRESQQDAFVNVILSKTSGLFVVCDGMGGMKDGGEAARLTCETMGAFASGHNVEDYINSSNYSVVSILGKNSGTTVAAVLVKDSKASIYHAGDSRVYVIKKGKITFRTKDHSVETEMIDNGVKASTAAKYQNCITNFVGIKPGYCIDISKKIVDDADYIMLCTDGLNRHLSDNEILDQVLKFGIESASLLTTMADYKGGSDNTTVTVIKLK